jgi:hypothetical protein
MSIEIFQTGRYVPDARDKAIADEIAAAYLAFNGPRVGDWAEMPDGTYKRIAHSWGDSIQLCSGGSFYVSKSGASMSGGLDDAIDASRFAATDQYKVAGFWFPHHDNLERDCAIGLRFPVKVWQVHSTSDLESYVAVLKVGQVVDMPENEEWKDVISRIKVTGKINVIKSDTYFYFLGVLPPKYQVKGTFAFAEGDECLRLFWDATTPNGWIHYCRQLNGFENAAFRSMLRKRVIT